MRPFLDKGLTDFRSVLGAAGRKGRGAGPRTGSNSPSPPAFPIRDLPESVGGLPILSKADYEAKKRDLEEFSLEPFLGTGAYMFDSMNVGQQIIYKRNPDYWGKDLPINIGPEQFRHASASNISAIRTPRSKAFKAGVYTFRNENSSKNWATAYDFPAVTRWHGRQGRTADRQHGQRAGLPVQPAAREVAGPARARSDRADVQLRMVEPDAVLRALCPHQLDLGKHRHGGHRPGRPRTRWRCCSRWSTRGCCPPQHPDRRGGDGAGSRATSQLDRGNLRKASALLDEAGWAVGDDGMRRNAKGETLTVEFLNDSPAFERRHQALCRKPEGAGRRCQAGHGGRRAVRSAHRTADLRFRHHHRQRAVAGYIRGPS